MRVIQCPKCENEVFSSNAGHCKIYGTKLFNECEGVPEYDDHGYEVARPIHNNPGNARYCETCGEPTNFFKQGFLKPWEEEKADLEESSEMEILDNSTLDEVAVTTQQPFDIDDGDLPF